MITAGLMRPAGPPDTADTLRPLEADDSCGARTGPSLAEDVFAHIRRRAVLEGCKWDPQVGDQSTLAPFPILLAPSTWQELAKHAEALTRETTEAEQELLAHPEWIRTLGLPARLSRIFAKHPSLSPTAARVMRFDFHPTRSGWKISEVNSDVPGGFSEASYFTNLMAEQYRPHRPTGNPVQLWADAIAAAAGSAGTVGLLTAPGFMEDHQVVACLATELNRRGCQAALADPTQLRWIGGIAHLVQPDQWRRLDAVVRFFQAEWLTALPKRCDWTPLLCGGHTPMANPGSAILTESKRFPLVWDRLQTPLPIWRSLLPETLDPRQTPWNAPDPWILKSALTNTGDEVLIRDGLPAKTWRRARWNAWCQPKRWVAQRKFDSAPVDTPLGPMHLCLGVYTIDGQAAGAYGRLSRRPLIDYQAIDAAVLLDTQTPASHGDKRHERKRV